LAAVAFFLVHPVQVESVAWIAERKSVLSAVFIFLSLLVYLKRTRPGPRSFSIAEEWPVLSLTLLAMLSKPIAVVIPLVLATLDLTRIEGGWPGSGGAPLRRRDLIRAVTSKWPYFLLAMGGAAMTLFGHAIAEAFTAEERHPIPTFLTMLSIVPEYVRIVLFPTMLSAIRVVPEQETFMQPLVLLGLSLMMVAAIAATRLARHSRVVAFFTVWVIAAMLPVSNLIQLDVYIAERYLYLPMVAFGTLLGFMLFPDAPPRGRRSGLVLLSCCMAILLCFASLTFARVQVWRSSESLWVDTIEKSPRAAKAHVNLGLLRLEEGDLERAKFHFKEGIRLAALDDAWLNLGIALSREGETINALSAFEVAKRGSPAMSDVDYWRGRMLSELGRIEESEAAYREELERRPDFMAAWIDLSLVQARQGRLEEALGSSEQAAGLAPDNPEALLNLGVLRWNVRRDASGARAALERCIRNANDPTHAERARKMLELIGAATAPGA
jgi:Tfp pilus assembly protein PilF